MFLNVTCLKFNTEFNQEVGKLEPDLLPSLNLLLLIKLINTDIIFSTLAAAGSKCSQNGRCYSEEHDVSDGSDCSILPTGLLLLWTFSLCVALVVIG